MTHIYDILDTVKDELRSSPFVNTVTYGDVSMLDLDKTTMFPLSHLLISNVEIGKRTLNVNIKLFCADVVDYNPAQTEFDDFYSNNNSQDIMNTQFEVINGVLLKLMRGSLFAANVQVLNSPIAEPFMEKHGNTLTGWTTQIQIEIPNNNSAC